MIKTIALLLTFSGFYSGLGRNAIAHRIRTQKRRHAPLVDLGRNGAIAIAIGAAQWLFLPVAVHPSFGIAQGVCELEILGAARWSNHM